jgi:hypothetical protein
MDDIVFPISEGLNRRFIRVELQGADVEEVQQYLGMRRAGDTRTRHLDAANAVVRELFRAAKQEQLLVSTEAGERLQFGVGYFNLLASWVCGELEMPQTFMEQELDSQAAILLETSLRSATRNRAYDAVFAQLRKRLS